MASFRRLPNRKWQAEVLLPVRLANGRQKRVTKTHPSKMVVREWATKLEADVDAGTFVQPRAGDLTLREFHDRWETTRVVSSATVGKAASHWRNHVEPAFGGHPVALITRPQLKRWVKGLVEEACPRCHARPGTTRGTGRLVKHVRDDTGKTCTGSGLEPGLGAWTVQGAVSTLSAMLSAAVEEGVIAGNPAHGLKLPRVDTKPPFFWTKTEAAQLVTAAGEYGLMIDLDMHVGLRWGELAGLRRRYVDLEHGHIHVVGVQTRSGWREYPKTRMSRRTVPIPPRLVAPMRAACEGLAGDAAVFPAPEGGAWDDTNFRRRVFRPALEAAGVPAGTPHDMRHTAASWLVQAGVDLYRVQMLLGHESFRTTQRYAHLAPDHFDKIMEAWT
jgi:integrase